jgi:hypothetical protein
VASDGREHRADLSAQEQKQSYIGDESLKSIGNVARYAPPYSDTLPFCRAWTAALVLYLHAYSSFGS